MTNLVLGGSTPSDGFELKSARFEDSDSAYLSRTMSAASNRKTYTLSCWVKRSELGNKVIFAASGGSGDDGIHFHSDDCLRFYTNSGNGDYKTTAKYRDTAAWYHIVMAIDTTQATAGDRMRLYVNGEEVTDFSTETAPSQNADSLINNNNVHRFGSWASGPGAYFNGYLAEAYFIDGYQLTPSSFAETNEDTNQWQPKNPTDIKKAVTFGNNGFYLPFSNDTLTTNFIPRTGPYTAATFTSTGSTTWTAPAGVTSVDYLVVAGGGGGAGEGGGGGGGGGMRTGTLSVTPTSSYTVTVGDGGAGTASGAAARGGDSVFSTITSSGGAMGQAPAGNGQDGGSGGGAGYGGNAGAGNTPSTSPSQGASGGAGGPYGGGAANSHSGGGGGGGGASGTAGAAGTNADGSGVGGNGTASSISGVSKYYAGGGGGGTIHPFFSGLGGLGGGGAGGNLAGGLGMPGTDGLGGGGGGASGTGTTHSGGDGGSGIVIIRYFDAAGTLTNDLDKSITANGNAKNERISNNKPYAENQTHIIGPKVGSSAIKFDGSGDYLSAPDHADWALGSSDFTLESWINTIAKADQVLFSQYEDSSNRWYLRLDERDGQQDIGFYDIDGGISIEASDGSWPGINQWVHMAFVRSSGVIKIYIDGSEVTLKTNTNPSASWGNYAATLRIGDYNGGNNFEGYLDEIRISNTARYTSNFTPSTTAFSSDSNTKLLIHSNTTHGSTTFDDSGATDHTITATGNIKHIAPKIGTGIGVFDGNNDYLNFNNSSTMPEFMIPGNGVHGDGGTITYETWVSFNSIPTNDTNSNTIFASTAGNLSANYSRLVYDSGLKWRWRIYNSSDSLIMGLDAADSLSVDTWYHVAFVMNGTNCKIYRDGVEKGSATMSGTPRTPDRTFHWGRYDRSSGSGNYMNGYMDESRISSSARYTSGFTPSTTAFKDDKDTLLLLHMDGGGGIDPLTNLPTLPGQGTYFWDASVDAIFYNADGTPANKSIITFDGTGDYLSVPTSTDFNPGTNFTVECWFQYGGDDEGGIIGNQNSSGYNGWFFRIVNTTDKLDWNNYGGSGGAEVQVITAGSLVWNTGQWYHLAMVKEGNDYELFRDGTSVATLTSSASLTNGGALFIGKDYASDETVCKMDQIRISNSARYTSNFTPPTTPFTSDVNTKLLIQSEFSEGGLGADHSNNYNYFTPTNLGVDDMMEDSSTNDFCTFNPLNGKSDLTAALKEGSLQVGTGVGASGFNLFSTFGVTSGKWYYEYRDNSPATRNSGVGWCDVVNADKGTTVEALIAVGAVWYNNIMYQQGSSAAIGATLDKNTIAGVALDADAGKVWFSHNGVWWDSQNPATGANPKFTAGTNPTTWTPIYHQGNQGNGTVNYGQDSSFDGAVTAQGNQDENNKGDFYYPVPSGFLALCTDNLDDPLIESPEDHFNTVAYSGNESNPTSAGAERIIDCGFQPDLTWLKIRTQDFSNRLFDSIRGSNKALYSNATAAEAAGTSGYIDRFVSNGPVLKAESDGDNRDVNVTGDTYVVWNWKAGGAPTADNSAGAGNTPTAGSVKINGSNLGSALAGTIPATRLTANTTAGFSIVKWAGSGSNATVAHGLSQAPELIINKSITGSSSTHQWAVQSLLWQSASDTNMMYLNSTGAQSDDTNVFQAAPTTTVFSPQGGGWGGIGASGETYITYCWHSVEGYSKVGTFAGNGGVDGPFIYLGFKPGWVMIKTSNLSNHQWYIWDNKRVVDNPNNKVMYPSTNLGDQTSNDYLIDFLSNGFKVRNASNFDNNSSGAYLYMAFAEEPFKTAHAR